MTKGNATKARAAKRHALGVHASGGNASWERVAAHISFAHQAFAHMFSGSKASGYGGVVGSGIGLGGGTGGHGGSGTPRGAKSSSSWGRRLVRWLLRGLLGIVLLLLCTSAWLTSPWGEGALGRLVQSVANSALQSQGLRLHVGGLGGLWQGQLRVWDVRMEDAKGTWLSVPWLRVVVRVSELFSGRIHIPLLEMEDVAFVRGPELPPSAQEPQPEAAPAPIRALPQGWELIIGDVRISSLQVGEGEEALHFFARALGTAGHTNANLRLGLQIYRQGGVGFVPPPPVALPEDLTAPPVTAAAQAQAQGVGFVGGASGEKASAMGANGGTAGNTVQGDGAATFGAEQDKEARDKEAQTEEAQADEGLAPLWQNSDTAARREAQEADSAGQDGRPVQERPGSRASAASSGTESSGTGSVGTGGQGARATAASGAQPVFSGQGVSPRVGPSLPPESRRTRSLMAEIPAMAALVTLDWQDNYVDVRVQNRDTLFLAEALPGIERFWSRTRVQAHVSQWPPDKDHAVQMRFVSRFGLRGAALGDVVRPSQVGGQMLWDGNSLIAQDIDLSVPVKDPDVQLRGSLGYNTAHGPGMQLQLILRDLASLSRLAGMQDAGIAGNMSFTAGMSRGGEHAAWWAKPLSQPAVFEKHPLVGFAVLLPQKQQGVALPVLPDVAGARASLSPTALHADVRLDVPEVRLPQGDISVLQLEILASSADAATAPQGTTSRKQVGEGMSDGTPSANSQAALGEAHTADKERSAQGDTDFTALGLPKALVGKVDLRVASLLGMGDASCSTRWFAAGWPGVADIFQAQLDDISVKFPGGRMEGALGLAYALPMRRLWPWLDGTLRVQVDNWEALSRLATMPMRGQGVGVEVGLESLYDPQGRARQYLKAEFKAAQVTVPSFSVQAVDGRATSQHVHALADALSLTIDPARRGSTSPEPSPADDLSLLDASVRMGAGAGGPLTWSAGNCLVRVAGENGTFEARLQGALNAAVAGSYNFRQRLLKLQDMQLSYLVPAEKPPLAVAGLSPISPLRAKAHTVGLQLRTPAQVALGDAAGNMTVEGLNFALLPSGSLSVNARVPMSGSTDPLQCALELQRMPLDIPHGFATLFAGGAGVSGAGSTSETGSGNQKGSKDKKEAKGKQGTPPRAAAVQAASQSGASGATPAWLADFPGGEVSVALRVGGALDAPTGNLELLLSQIRSAAAPGVPPLDVDIRGTLKKAAAYSIFDVRGVVTGLPEGGKGAEGAGTLDGIPMGGPRFSAQIPVRTGGSAGAGLVSTAPLAANVTWGGLLAPLLELYPLPGKKVTGQAALRAAVAGTLDKPDISAAVVLRDGAFEDILQGVMLRDMRVDAQYTSQGTSKILASLGDGRGGTVRVDGTVRGISGKEPEVEATGKIMHFRPLRRDDLAVTLGGDLQVQGSLLAPLIKGNIVLEEGSFELLQGFGSSVRTLDGVTVEDGSSTTATVAANVTARDDKKIKSDSFDKNSLKSKNKGGAKGQNQHGTQGSGNATVTQADTDTVPAAVPRLDVAFSAPGKFFIRGQGLNSEWRTNLYIRGPVTAPRLVGDVSPVRGTFDFLGKEFRFSGGKMSFDGSNPPNPALDLRLELRSGQVTAFVDVKGTGRTPRLDLTSEPPLPRDEVMAQVLFGKDMNNLSRFETIQAATAAAQLTGMGPGVLASMSSVRKGLGLDALRMGRGGGNKGAEVGRGMTSGVAGATAGAGAESETQSSVLEAGKYVTDSIYVGVEQGLRPQDGTGVRVDVELTPSLSLSGRTSQQSSGVGLGWKLDY